jgi:hypothetical protein
MRGWSSTTQLDLLGVQIFLCCPVNNYKRTYILYAWWTRVVNWFVKMERRLKAMPEEAWCELIMMCESSDGCKSAQTWDKLAGDTKLDETAETCATAWWQWTSATQMPVGSGGIRQTVLLRSLLWTPLQPLQGGGVQRRSSPLPGRLPMGANCKTARRKVQT